jgi:hypothetical protein
MMSDYKVEMVNDGMQEFFVEFQGPTESAILAQNPVSILFLGLMICVCAPGF